MARVIPPYSLGEKVGHCVEIPAGTVGEVLDEAERLWGADFRDVLAVADVTVGGLLMSRLQGRRTPVVADTVIAFTNPALTWLPPAPEKKAEQSEPKP